MQANPLPLYRTALIAGLGVLIAWQVVTRSLGAYLARETPLAALNLNAAEPTALLNLADAQIRRTAEAGDSAGADQPLDSRGDRLGDWSAIALKAISEKLDPAPGSARRVALPPVTPEDREQIRALAERAVRNDPLNARALRILGQLAEGSGDSDTAIRFMRASANRSLSEAADLYAMLRHSFEVTDHPNTIYYADALMRKRPQLIAAAAPLLARMAESPDPKAHTELEKMLRADPPWRQSWFANLLPAITDARTPLKLFLSLKDTKAAPHSGELKDYLHFLIGRKFYELAYYTWLQFLPPAQLANIGLINNGSFTAAPSGMPFDWIISPGPGVTIDIAARPDATGDRGLFLEFGPGRADFRGVSQLLMLPAGDYRFRGRFQGDIKGRRGVQWHVSCAGGKPVLADGPMFTGVKAQWAEFAFIFTVPATDCRAQELRLDLAARSASEQLVSGSVWYDDLRIERDAPRVEGDRAPLDP